jgi:hypothetical protein
MLCAGQPVLHLDLLLQCLFSDDQSERVFAAVVVLVWVWGVELLKMIRSMAQA